MFKNQTLARSVAILEWSRDPSLSFDAVTCKVGGKPAECVLIGGLAVVRAPSEIAGIVVDPTTFVPGRRLERVNRKDLSKLIAFPVKLSPEHIVFREVERLSRAGTSTLMLLPLVSLILGSSIARRKDFFARWSSTSARRASESTKTRNAIVSNIETLSKRGDAPRFVAGFEGGAVNIVGLLKHPLVYFPSYVTMSSSLRLLCDSVGPEIKEELFGFMIPPKLDPSFREATRPCLPVLLSSEETRRCVASLQLASKGRDPSEVREIVPYENTKEYTSENQYDFRRLLNKAIKVSGSDKVKYSTSDVCLPKESEEMKKKIEVLTRNEAEFNDVIKKMEVRMEGLYETLKTVTTELEQKNLKIHQLGSKVDDRLRDKKQEYYLETVKLKRDLHKLMVIIRQMVSIKQLRGVGNEVRDIIAFFETETGTRLIKDNQTLSTENESNISSIETLQEAVELTKMDLREALQANDNIKERLEKVLGVPAATQILIGQLDDLVVFVQTTAHRTINPNPRSTKRPRIENETFSEGGCNDVRTLKEWTKSFVYNLGSRASMLSYGHKVRDPRLALNVAASIVILSSCVNLLHLETFLLNNPEGMKREHFEKALSVINRADRSAEWVLAKGFMRNKWWADEWINRIMALTKTVRIDNSAVCRGDIKVDMDSSVVRSCISAITKASSSRYSEMALCVKMDPQNARVSVPNIPCKPSSGALVEVLGGMLIRTTKNPRVTE